MDPTPDKIPGLDLSLPSVEKGMPPYTIQGGAKPGVVEAQGGQMLPVLNAGVPVAQSASTPSVLPDTNAQTPAVPGADDDSVHDELDKEWINKAKAIVDKTHNDPFLQSNELGKVKADYLRTRYNKQIKVAEDRTK